METDDVDVTEDSLSGEEWAKENYRPGAGSEFAQAIEVTRKNYST